MTLPIVPILLVGTLVVAAVVWWLMGRIAPGGWPKFVLRVGGLAGVVALAGLVALPALRAQSQSAAAQNAAPVVPVETMTVSTGTLAQTLSASGSLAAADQTTLSFQTSAPVVEVLVKPGDVVKAGDMLAKLDTTDAAARLRNAQIGLADAQSSFDALVAPPRDIDVRIAENQIQSAQASLSGASQGPSAADIEIARLQAEKAKNQLWQQQVNRDVQLAPPPEFRGKNADAQANKVNAGLQQSAINVQIAEDSYQATKDQGPSTSQVASADAGLVSAQAKLAQLLSGPSESDQRKAQIAIDNAQLALQLAQQEMNQTLLVAPFDGLVAAEDLTVGMTPAADAITMIDISHYTIDLSIDETDVPQVAVGQPVDLTIQALPDATLSGTITKIDVAPTISGQLVTYNAQVTLTPGQAALRPGMSATANVILNQINDVIVVPNRFITTDAATRQASVTVETTPGVYQAVPVTLGLRNTTASQVVDGLRVGQTIVILPQAGQASSQNGGFGFFRVPGGGGGRPPGGGFGGRGG